jgi:ribosomal-protein-alanine N-acetyltransferase
MITPRLDLHGGYFLSPVELGDQDACVEHLKDRAVHDGTLRIPFPYTRSHANEWIAAQLSDRFAGNPPTIFAVREPAGVLVGAISVEPAPAPDAHRGEIGYWISRPFRGQNLATAAVIRIVQYGWDVLGVRRIHGYAFLFNRASMRVLEKAGFRREGILRQHFAKHDALLDAAIYGILRDDERLPWAA